MNQEQPSASPHDADVVIVGGGPVGTYKTGETFFEPPGTLHVFAENPDPVKPARLVAVFVADANCGPLVLPPD